MWENEKFLTYFVFNCYILYIFASTKVFVFTLAYMGCFQESLLGLIANG